MKRIINGAPTCIFLFSCGRAASRYSQNPLPSPNASSYADGAMLWEGGGYWKPKKPKINSVGWRQHTRVENNKTNRAQDNRFCSTASRDGKGGGVKLENLWKENGIFTGQLCAYSFLCASPDIGL